MFREKKLEQENPDGIVTLRTRCRESRQLVDGGWERQSETSRAKYVWAREAGGEEAPELQRSLSGRVVNQQVNA
ncbi:hypothetical protein E5D57_005976 [Metarhizium anisopliae]|nr:hypothetical protein E5D57_005976 [Metarhizium anisopliae]